MNKKIAIVLSVEGIIIFASGDYGTAVTHMALAYIILNSK